MLLMLKAEDFKRMIQKVKKKKKKKKERIVKEINYPLLFHQSWSGYPFHQLKPPPWPH